jgi:membrane protein DedA with SNARE-associated domain
MSDIVDKLTGLDSFVQIAIIIISSLISEDITVISVALGYFSGQITEFVYFVGIFFALLLGDTLLYFVGRLISKGRDSILGFDIVKFKQGAEKYENQGFIFLVVTRFTPGFRMPSIVAAGLVNFNLALFILAKIVSIIILFILIQLFGEAFLSLLDKVDFSILLYILISILLLFLLVRFYRRYLNNTLDRKLFFYSLAKYKYYEYWPPQVFYFPMLFIWPYLSLKYLNSSAPYYANPAMDNSGLVGESKHKVNSLLDSKSDYFLKTELLLQGDSLQDKLNKLDSFTYPLILKPDYGQKGKGVFLAKDKSKAEDYIRNNNYDIIIQKYSDFENEAGILIYKDPDDNQKVKLFSVTEKLFPKLKGDGEKNIKELILNDARARYNYSIYQKRLGDNISYTPKRGEVIDLVFSGNHAQGTEFIDATENYSKSLIIEKLANILGKVEGLNFCRFDIRYKNLNSIIKGNDFHIIEINGSGAESTNIYDRKFSFLRAYKILYKQWDLAFKIGKNNFLNFQGKKLGKFLSGIKLIFLFRKYKKIEKKYPVSS